MSARLALLVVRYVISVDSASFVGCQICNLLASLLALFSLPAVLLPLLVDRFVICSVFALLDVRSVIC